MTSLRNVPRRLARAALARQVRQLPTERREWGEALLAELDQAGTPWEAVAWAAGGLRAGMGASMSRMSMWRRGGLAVWLALTAGLGLGLGWLSLELVGLVLLPVGVALLLTLARRHGHRTSTLVAMVAGFELAVAAIGVNTLQSTRDRAVSYPGAGGAFGFLAVVAAVGIVVLVIGLRIGGQTARD